MNLSSSVRLLQPRVVQLCNPRRRVASVARRAASVDADPSMTLPPMDQETRPDPSSAAPAAAAQQPVEPKTRFSVDKPADSDAMHFKLDPSVAFWKDFATRWSWNALGTCQCGCAQFL